MWVWYFVWNFEGYLWNSTQNTPYTERYDLYTWFKFLELDWTVRSVFLNVTRVRVTDDNPGLMMIQVIDVSMHLSRDQSSYAPSQWETSLHCNNVSHWLGAYLDRPLLRGSRKCRVDSRFAPSQWETALLCNDISHWLGASLESALMDYRNCNHEYFLS